MNQDMTLNEEQLEVMRKYAKIIKEENPEFEDMDSVRAHFRKYVPEDLLSDEIMEWWGILAEIECKTDDPYDEEWSAYYDNRTDEVIPPHTNVGYLLYPEEVLPELSDTHYVELFKWVNFYT